MEEMTIEDHLKRIKEIQKELEYKYSAMKEMYNGKECKNGCNCAFIASGCDEENFDKIKNGYPCLKQ